jgi:4-hydroxybenzoate polyprenyltransferase/phosphoserine phosphatase
MPKSASSTERLDQAPRGSQSAPAEARDSSLEQQARRDAAAPVAAPAAPLAVDLDGTLVRTDVLVESVIVLLKRQPLFLFAMLAWLLRGAAHLKAQVARRVELDAATLPYRGAVLQYLQGERAAGRRLVLATGADERVARRIADRLGLFEAVLASDGKVNLSGERKRARLVAEFGEKGFDYLGSGRRDLPVWGSARRAVVVGPADRLCRRAARLAVVERVADPRAGAARDYLRALRMHHWLKNLLVFTPLVTSHRIADPALFGQASIAFVAFGLCASSVYLLNDLADLAADRHHPRKRERPLASGKVSMGVAVAAIPGLLAAALAVSLALPAIFPAVIAGYFVLNVAYSLRLKSVAILDVLVLAALYTLRIVAGSAAVDIWPSAWLLAFSMFLFLSLALVKRYAELMAMRAVEGAQAKARGYRLEDAELLASLGGGAGYLAVLVLALYIDSASSHALYSRQGLLWVLCFLLLYWVSYLWLMAHRKRMHDDPLVFALRDPVSRTLLLLMAVAVVAAV